LGEHPFRLRGRPQGGDDFGVAKILGHNLLVLSGAPAADQQKKGHLFVFLERMGIFFFRRPPSKVRRSCVSGVAGLTVGRAIESGLFALFSG
jgi:hypothetical protein